MPQLIKPTAKVKVIPNSGEVEITLNINITIDGKVMATADRAEVAIEEEQEGDETPHLIPDFLSGMKLNFGKKE